jgi:hypothetical protein
MLPIIPRREEGGKADLTDAAQRLWVTSSAVGPAKGRGVIRVTGEYRSDTTPSVLLFPLR